MINSIKARTPILALILFVFAVGFTVAATSKVVVIPLGADAAPAPTLPAGMVSSFNSETCPTGWEKFTNAQGRTVVGLNDGGTLGYTEGSAYIDREVRSHAHAWIFYSPGGKFWHTKDYYGNRTDFFDWGDGIGAEGSGYYPLAMDGGDNYEGWRYTNKTVSTPPYVQLLYCEKI